MIFEGLEKIGDIGWRIRVSVVSLCILPICISFLLLVGCGPGKPNERAIDYLTVDGNAMGTTWSVQYQGAVGEAAQVREAINRLLVKLDDSMSTWRDGTDISRFNASDSTNWISVSTDMVEVIDAARIIHGKSGGALDPSVFPLIRLWGFTSSEPLAALPSDSSVAERFALVGFERIGLQREMAAIRKGAVGMEIDLSAIAKGYAVDRVSALLVKRSITNHLVEIGGELFGLGMSSKGRPWRVGLELPIVGASEIGQAVELSPGALATSGDYRNYIPIGEQRYAHIIDPKTGRPLLQQGIAVSVKATNCMMADGWATALTVLGVEQGSAIAEQMGVAANFSWMQDGEVVEQWTSHWKGTD